MHKPSIDKGMTMARIGSMLLLGVVGLSVLPAEAADWGEVSRVLSEITRTFEQGAREEKRLQQEYEQRQAERRRQEETRKQAEAEQRRQQEQAHQQALLALAAPPEYAGRIAIHRKLLTDEASAGPAAPDFELTTSLYQPAISPDGTWIAWEVPDSATRLRNTVTGEIRQISMQARRKYNSLNFVGNETLLIHNGKSGAALFDLQGKMLRDIPSLSDNDWAWPERAGVRWVVSVQKQDDNHRCRGLWYYDAQGNEISGVDVDAERCSGRITTQGTVEILTHRNGTVTHYVNGVKQNEFRGDNRSNYAGGTPGYGWLGQTPYVYSYINDGKKFQTRLWDIATGSMRCEFTGFPFADKSGNVFYISQPAARLSLSDCTVTHLGSGEETLTPLRSADGSDRGDSLLLLHDGASGHVDVLDATTGQVRVRLQTQHRGRAQFDYLPDGRLAISSGVPGNIKITGTSIAPTQIFNLNTGKLLTTLSVGKFDNGYVIGGKSDNSNHFSLWKASSTPRTGQTDFLAALQKDKFETRDEYRKRVAALSLPFTLKAHLKDYDADRGLFHALWRNVPLTVPMPPAQARQFSNVDQLTLEGQLRLLEGDFLELRSAQAVLPDGRRLPASTATGPLPPAKATPVAAQGKAPTASNPPASAITPNPSTTRASAACSDAELTALFEREQARFAPELASGNIGACRAGQIMKTLAEKLLSAMAICPASGSIDRFRNEIKQLRDESQSQINGACG